MTAYRYPLPRGYRRARYPHRFRKGSKGNQAVGLAIGGVLAASALGAGTHAAVVHHHAKATAPAPATVNAAAARVVSFARAQLGKPYLWGGTGPGAFDCSGLAMEAYAAAGIAIERTSEQQWATLPHVPRSQVRPGDLVFFPGSDGTWSAPGHVAIVISATQMIQAYATGTPIEISPLNGDGAGGIVGFARPQAPAPPVTAAAPGPGEAGFISGVLGAVGAPRTGANESSMAAWARHEWPSWPPGANWNPLDTTEPAPGASVFNSAGVRSYPSAAEGVQATAATLLGGYPAIVAALRSGQGICGGGFANELLTWSGGGYQEVC